jgi:cytoskeletal protein CcmA (bactofilin family)
MFIVGINVTIDGNIKSDGDVSVQGIVRGRIEAASIRISPTAHVSGTLVASQIIIDGFATVDIYADHLTLSDTSTVRGRIFHADLIMARQAFFEGQSRRYPHPLKVFADAERAARISLV